MKFDPKNYETVKSRKARFYKDYPDGRIIVESLTSDPNEYAMFKAYIYTDLTNQIEKCPKATGFAHEIRDKEMKKNKYGNPYESVNYTSWNENCEESAVGRALDNAGYSGNLRCSLEEIEQAEKKNQSYNKTDTKTKTETDTKTKTETEDILWVTETQFKGLMLLDSVHALQIGVNTLKEQGAVFNKKYWSALTARKKILMESEEMRSKNQESNKKISSETKK